MALPPFFDTLRLPVIAAPLFIISNPRLVIAQCQSGVIGSFPALNAREAAGEPIELVNWLTFITEELDRFNQANPDHPAAPFAVNQIVHKSNTRLERDIEICARFKVPLWITSLGAREDVNQAAHSCGGLALHDVTTDAYARKAIAKGADGLIAVAAGAGGHAGTLSPFALIQEIRGWFAGPLLLSGAIARGESILAAQVMGADLAYIGSAFIATHEARAADAYKAMIVNSTSSDIVYTDLFTGVPGNYLKASIMAQGLDPECLPTSEAAKMDFSASRPRPKSWRDIWGAGQGIGVIDKEVSTAALVERLANEYRAAKSKLARLCAD